MTKDEALKLALEALEEAADAIDSWGSYASGYFQVKHDLEGDISKAKSAIAAMKEALAQPEQDWIERERAVGYREGHQNALKQMAQPEQEPVAWMDDYNACKCPDNEARCFSDKVFRMMQKHTNSLAKQQEPVAKVCHDLDGHIGWNPNLLQLPDEGTPLYTTPLQRKPLTDEEIDKAWRSCDYTVPWEQHRIDIARAIEAAHGIKRLV